MDEQKKNFWEQLASATGTISAKRVTGMTLLFIVMCCVIYLTINEGGTHVVEDLLQTAMILGATLLGISSITSIWKTGKMSIGNHEECEEEPTMECNCPRCIEEREKQQNSKK